jgi:hypothetical protein
MRSARTGRSWKQARRGEAHLNFSLQPSAFGLRPLPCAPLNKERRFIPLRLDGAPIKGSLAQFLYINWRPANGEQESPNASRQFISFLAGEGANKPLQQLYDSEISTNH